MTTFSDLEYLEFMTKNTTVSGGTAIAQASSQAFAAGPNRVAIMSEIYISVLSHDGINVSNSSSSSSAIAN